MDEVHGKGNSDEMIKCDLCDYTTTLKRNYRKHVRQMHTKREKLLLCDQCNLRFELPYQLKDHKDIVHEGNSKKLQSCDQCDKKFRYPHQVKDHKNLVHLGKLIHIKKFRYSQKATKIWPIFNFYLKLTVRAQSI